MTSPDKVVVWGLLAAMPFPGMMWHRLQYLVGLKRLGFDVWYVEDSDRPLQHPVTLSPSWEYEDNLAYLARHLEAVGLGDRWVFRPPGQSERCVGALDFEGLKQLYRDAEFVVNHCGAQELLPHHAGIRQLVYLETDPVPNQVGAASGNDAIARYLSAHDHRLTYATNVHGSDCLMPSGGFDWIPTLPAICVDWWQTDRRPAEPKTLTTITTWKHSGKDVEWNGHVWRWSKHHEFLKFMDLPSRASMRLELAVGGITEPELETLAANGWHTTRARELDTIDKYRDYVWSSAGEFTVSKEQYVAPRTGWFSDRSATFLASGRPVVTQYTAFECTLPSGEGLFSFSTTDEAAAAIDAIASDYERHSRAARDIAAEHFAADRVLGRALAAMGFL